MSLKPRESAARARLLETAGKLFAERGYECVGINEVIARASIAKATFYQHFPGKQDLCAAWLLEQAKRAALALLCGSGSGVPRGIRDQNG